MHALRLIARSDLSSNRLESMNIHPNCSLVSLYVPSMSVTRYQSNP